jgi:hypothetical protein
LGTDIRSSCVDFLSEIIEKTGDLVCAYKVPAFKDWVGRGGLSIFIDVVNEINSLFPDVPVILDGTSDPGLAFGIFGADAVFVSPYRNEDVKPIVAYPGKGIIVHCLEANGFFFEDIGFGLQIVTGVALGTRGYFEADPCWAITAHPHFSTDFAKLREVTGELPFFIPLEDCESQEVIESITRWAAIPGKKSGLILS